MVDGGVRVADPSTIVDMTGGYPKVIRQGKVIFPMSSPGTFLYSFMDNLFFWMYVDN